MSNEPLTMTEREVPGRHGVWKAGSSCPERLGA